MNEFRKYIKSITPTKKGLLALGICLVVIPLGVDFFLLAVKGRLREDVFMSTFLMSSYVKYFPLLLLYLLAFFIVWQIFEWLMQNTAMKYFFTHAENWLLITPIFIWLIERAILGYSTLNFHLHDTYFVIVNASIGVAFIAVLLLPFLCHLLLRANNRGHKKILLWHVLLSCFSIVVLFTLSCNYQQEDATGLAGTPRRYYEFESSTSNVAMLSNTLKASAIMILVFVLLQVLFFVYAVVLLMLKKKI